MTSCLILAAGEGKRLRPLTSSKPKALVNFIDKPLIMHQIKILESVNITKIGIVTGYKSEKFLPFKYQTYNNHDYEKTNMVYSLFCGQAFFEDNKDDLIISYGDIVYERKNLQKLLDTEGDIVIMTDDNWLSLWSLRNENPINDAETMKFDRQGNIIELGKKPKSINEIESQYTGLIKISKNKIKEFIFFYQRLYKNKILSKDILDCMFLTHYLQLLIESGWIIRAAHVKSGWLEIDSTKDIELYESLYQQGNLCKLWNKNEKNL
tara:strand:+ start:7011 stop:7805 length:795 start_codon:yes stop_codon:yes gene_type:complete